MSEHKKETTDNEKGFFNAAIGVATQVAQTGLDLESIKEKASRAVDDGITEAKRMAKKGKYAAEDLRDDTAHYIKHDPFQSVAITFGVGLGLGILTGWLITRETKQRIG